MSVPPVVAVAACLYCVRWVPDTTLVHGWQHDLRKVVQTPHPPPPPPHPPPRAQPSCRPPVVVFDAGIVSDRPLRCSISLLFVQVLFLLYHYFEAKEVYNAIRVFIAGYVWMTGFGNFTYYYKTGDFAFPR